MLKKHENREQIQLFCLETAVAEDSVVRVIDAFVDALDLEELGFIIKGKIKNGAPAFRAQDLLKLYFYGYLNRTRSSRRLEREAQTNIEAIWLIRGLRPGYKTIADFRKDNPTALKNTFKTFNKFLLLQGLLDTEVIAVDGAKFRAQNSKKNNYNAKKVEQHLKYIDKKTNEYLKILEENDAQIIQEETEIEQEINEDIARKLDHLDQRKQKYQKLQKQVVQAREKGQTQFSSVDPDARALPKKMNIVEVGYNLVTAAEQQNYFITNFNLINENDTYALSNLAIEADEFLRQDDSNKAFTVIADKGFDTGHELMICAQNKINTIVAPKKRLSYKANKNFAKNKFIYDEENDLFTCPQNEKLKSNGTSYNKKAYGQYRASYKFKRYTCSLNICRKCPYKLDCVGEKALKASKGRQIERSEYEPYIEENIRRYKVSKEIYRRRQAMVEHQFGTIKRQWGYDHTLLKTKEKVAAEFALILSCYNLRRAITILGAKELIKRLKEVYSHFFGSIRVFFSLFELIFFDKMLDSCSILDFFRGRGVVSLA